MRIKSDYIHVQVRTCSSIVQITKTRTRLNTKLRTGGKTGCSASKRNLYCTLLARAKRIHSSKITSGMCTLRLIKAKVKNKKIKFLCVNQTYFQILYMNLSNSDALRRAEILFFFLQSSHADQKSKLNSPSDLAQWINIRDNFLRLLL